MSDHPDRPPVPGPSAPGAADPGRERVAPAIGVVLVVVAVLSLLDDAEVFDSSPVLPFVLVTVVAALALATRTAIRLLHP